MNTCGTQETIQGPLMGRGRKIVREKKDRRTQMMLSVVNNLENAN